MTGHEIRKRFLDYFRRQGHTVVPSASLVPADDPTLLFTGAGMNPFKDYFLGRRKDLKRAASCQKCFRTPDLEKVGKTAAHLTFFEMLGNFSFGDYFKEEACFWAWEFLTRELRLPPDRLWITIYEEDEEALAIWGDRIVVPAARILKFGAKDNFWPSNAPTEGPNGPCGPCSEIHYDYGCCTIGQVCPDPDQCQPGCPCGRFVEVWNLVFTQYDRQSDGSLKPLPAKNIDTGMGLERLTAVINGVQTNFETDLLKPIVRAAQEELKAQRPTPEVRAISDHVRALTFLIGDGVVPANDGRGYVARMLLRKAARHGRIFQRRAPFLYRLVPVVVNTMKAGYPELVESRERVAKVVKLEEERYQQTLEEKLPLLEQEVRQLAQTRISDPANFDAPVRFPASRAAWFYDTHGLVYEDIVEVAQQHMVPPPPLDEFQKALQGLQAKSKAASGFDGTIFAQTQSGRIAELGFTTTFVGYATLESEAKVVAILQDGRPVDRVQAPAQILLLLDQTPFYGESGGQLGDTGTIEGAQGKLVVEDTKRVDPAAGGAGPTIVHVARLVEGSVHLHDPIRRAVVDPARRQQVARNHTATHLLHAALRTVLGTHVQQAGSLVAPDRLRFDFTHSEKISASRLTDIETLVNQWACGNYAVNADEMAMSEAKAAGALAFFGEKYTDPVRVITIGSFSKELCGGTHLQATGQVGVLTVVDEGSVASGIRRIEALTGEAALAHLKGAEGQLLELAQRLKTPREKLGDAVERLRAQVKTLQTELERLKLVQSRAEADTWTVGATLPNGIQIVYQEIPQADMAQLRKLYDAWKQRAVSKSILCLGSRLVDSAFLVAGASADLVQSGFSAKAVIDRLAPIIEGNGGGRPEFAQAGGRNPAKLDDALKQVVPLVKELTR